MPRTKPKADPDADVPELRTTWQRGVQEGQVSSTRSKKFPVEVRGYVMEWTPDKSPERVVRYVNPPLYITMPFVEALFLDLAGGDPLSQQDRLERLGKGETVESSANHYRLP